MNLAIYLAIKNHWKNVDPTTLKMPASFSGGSLTEDKMVAEQNRYKTSKMIKKVIYAEKMSRRSLWKIKTYPSNKGKQWEILKRNEPSIW